MRRACLSGALIGLVGCSSTFWAPHGPKAAKVPVRWIVVERRAEELAREGILYETRLDPRSTLMVLQPLYQEDLVWLASVEAHYYFVELLEVSPAGTASPGEVVTARVRIGRAKAEGRYRITAIPLNPEVRILGDREHDVRGSTPTLFRFTSMEGGRGGIAVCAEQIE